MLETKDTLMGNALKSLELRADAPREQTLYALARVAKAVYVKRDSETISDVREAFSTWVPIRKGQISALVVANEEHVVLTFRGRDEESEWFNALTHGQVETEVGGVHGGMLEELEGAWDEVLAALYDADAHSKTFWQTGHSLGGALGLLAALELAELGYSPHTTVTFGSPPVLDSRAAKAVTWPVYRVVNNEDGVPDFHWPSLFDSYVHAGERVFLTPSGAVGANRYSPELARRIDRARTIGDGPMRAGFIHDHLMDSYLAKLAKLSES